MALQTYNTHTHRERHTCLARFDRNQFCVASFRNLELSSGFPKVINTHLPMLSSPAQILRSVRSAKGLPRATILSSGFRHNAILPLLVNTKCLESRKPSLGVHIHSFRSFHTSRPAFDDSGINPNYPDEPAKIPRVRKPGRYFAESIDSSKYRLSNDPIYISPAGPQIAFTKRASYGLAALSCYLAYLGSMTTSISPLVATLVVLPLTLPIPFFQYLSAPYVNRVFRLYKKVPPVERVRALTPEEEAEEKALGYTQPRTYLEPQPDTFESIVDDETLVVEQIGKFGRSTSATQIKLSDIRIVHERFGWVNWVYTDPETKEVIKLYIADNVGGIKMDRIWGIIEKNSGIDNGRGFLNQE